MSFAGVADREAIESEMPWEARPVAKTLYQMLSETAGKFPNHKAISYQIQSGPQDKAETLTWSELLAQTCQAANCSGRSGSAKRMWSPMSCPTVMRPSRPCWAAPSQNRQPDQPAAGA